MGCWGSRARRDLACVSVTWLGAVPLCWGQQLLLFPPSNPALCLQKVESGSDSDSKVDSDSEMGNATVDMTKSDSNSDSDSDVSVKKPQRGRKPGRRRQVTPRRLHLPQPGRCRLPREAGERVELVLLELCCERCPAVSTHEPARAPADRPPVALQLRNPLPSPVAGNRSPSVSRPAPAVTGETGALSPCWVGGSPASPPTRGVQACPVLGSDSDSDVDRISEWKRRDEERRRELEEKRKREQEEEIRRLREQEKEEKEKRKEKAEKGEEAHSDSDSSADDEVAKKGRKGRAKAPSSSDSELEVEKEVSAAL